MGFGFFGGAFGGASCAASCGLGLLLLHALLVDFLVGDDGLALLGRRGDGVAHAVLADFALADDHALGRFAEDVVFNGHGHGRGRLGGGCYVELDAVLLEGGVGGGTEGGNQYVAVLDVGEVLDEAAHADGREERYCVEFVDVELGEVAGLGGVHRGLGVFELGLVESFGVLGLLLVGAGEEVFLVAVLGHDLEEV